ncbi:MAG: hypothetical protein RhofKO_32590 [Rhodothermales bacterium]
MILVEDYIALSCLLPTPPPKANEQIQTTIDYEHLYSLAAKHNIYSHLLQFTKRVEHKWDRALSLRLQEAVSLSRNLGLLHTYHLRQILEALSAQHVAVIPVKGPMLSEMLYGDVGFRPCADLDLLIKPHTLAQGLEVLKRLGFKQNDRAKPTNTPKDVLLTHIDSGVKVELHTRLFNSSLTHLAPQEDLLWERSRLKTRQGVPHQQLDEGDYFVYLCVHCLAHLGIIELKWIADLFTFLRQQTAPLQFVTTTLAYPHWSDAREGVFLILHLLNTVAEITSAPLPVPDLEPTDKQFYLYVARHLISDAKRPIGDRVRLKYYIARTHPRPMQLLMRMLTESFFLRSERSGVINVGATWARIRRLLGTT